MTASSHQSAQTNQQKSAGDSIQVQNGPIIANGTAYLPPGKDISHTTSDVDYSAIQGGKRCKWFKPGVQDMEAENVLFPCFSHGFDEQLAAVHREQPMLAYAYFDEGKGKVHLWDIESYESAGLWVDSGGNVCMPINAHFDDGSCEVRLLYSSLFRAKASEVDEETQWVRRKGRNPGVPNKRRKT